LAITKDDIKLMASQRLADTDDGGGRMSGTEVQDGNVNNLFPDISRLDRTYGRVSLRKSFVGVFTDDDATYYGSNVILTDPADDPLVHTVLFTTNSFTDFRTGARDRMESYITQGPAFGGWLWNNQLEGSRALTLFAPVDADLPRVGDVWYLVEREGEGDEYSQYVRITSVEEEVRTFFIGQSFQRRVLTVGIGDPLLHSFHGVEVSPNDNVDPLARVYVGQVSDAAKYYGVSRLAEAASADDMDLKVSSIFSYLVPSAQDESNLSLVQAGGDAAVVMDSGDSFSFTTGNCPTSAGSNIYCGFGVKPGTLNLQYSSVVFRDDGAGNLTRNDVVEGRIDYGTGTLTFDTAPSYNYNWTLSGEPATSIARISNTHAIEVTLNNRGYNWLASLFPIPAPGTLRVDYMAQGKWYRLRDRGLGELLGDESGLGSGTIDYATGALIVTTGALPDADSMILCSWAVPSEYTVRNTDVAIEIPGVTHTLPHMVSPNSLTIRWMAGSVQRTATDDGNGNISGDGVGSIVYQSGLVYFRPNTVMDPGSDIEYEYDYYTQEEQVEFYGQPAGHVFDFTLSPAPIEAGSVVIIAVTAYGNLTITDDGAGNLQSNTVYSHWSNNDVELSLATGSTINYTTGDVHLVGILSGTWTYRTPQFTTVEITVGAPGAQIGGVYSAPRSVFAGYSDPVTEPYEGYFTINRDLTCRFSQDGITGQPETDTISSPAIVLDLLPLTADSVVPGSVYFEWAGHDYVDRSGLIYRDIDHKTNSGTQAGTIDYSTGLVSLTDYVSASNALTVYSLLSEFRPQTIFDCQFRTPGVPLRPGSFYVQCETETGETLNATADFNGMITGDKIQGTINTETGIAILSFGEWVVAEGNEAEPWYDANLIEGLQIWKPEPVLGSTVKYSCVVYTSIPLDSDLIGLNPVRLPSDGRVPIFRSGDVVVVHHTLQEVQPSPLSADQVLNLSRGDLSLIEMYDADGVFVPSAGNYVADLVAGTITMENPLDLSGFTEPLTALHRREDMLLVSDVQINGQLSFTAGLTHDYPADETMVSGALLFGDLRGRVYGLFDQKTWQSDFLDGLVGDPCTANYNDVIYPIVTTNKGAIEERWALVFDSATHFNVIGEQVGQIAEGYITTQTAPVNPATGVPYFTLEADGWGSGWATNNVLRFNTTAANGPLWVARTTLSGPVTEPDDQFVIQIRGDAD